jgi:hypothetical protein
MAELITEEQPRIKFGCEWVGACDPLTPDTTPELARLLALCQRMEALGAAPVLNDGLVGGNAGLLVVSERPPPSVPGWERALTSTWHHHRHTRAVLAAAAVLTSLPSLPSLPPSLPSLPSVPPCRTCRGRRPPRCL